MSFRANGTFQRRYRKSWMEWFPVLVLFGILAGAVGGMAVGLMTSHSSKTTVVQ